MKHIESILPENAADELTRLLLDDATISLALKELLHRATGCDIPSPNDTSTSDIEEMIPLCLRILRRFWNTPLTALGDGTNKKSFADTFKRLINNRVQCNEAFGIPPANADIPTAVSQLAQRHIDDGLTLTLTDGTTTTLPDGFSLANLLFSGLADNVTEIVDSNKGWIMTKNIFSVLPNLKKWISNVGEIVYYIEINKQAFVSDKLEDLDLSEVESLTDTNYNANYNGWFNFANLKKANFRKLKSCTGCLFVNGKAPDELELPELVTATRGLLDNVSGVKRILAPKLTTCNGYTYNPNLLSNCPDLEYAYIPNLSAYDVYNYLEGTGSLQDMPKLSQLVIGKVPFTSTSYYWRFALDGCPNLVLLDIRGGLNQNIYLDHWSPTTALAERLDEFLSNFQTYIADRVADMTGQTALTLTLSAAIYEALQAQEGQTILATLTNKNWTVAQA